MTRRPAAPAAEIRFKGHRSLTWIIGFDLDDLNFDLIFELGCGDLKLETSVKDLRLIATALSQSRHCWALGSAEVMLRSIVP